MRLIVASLIFLLSMASTAVWADKVTNDPNAPGATRSSSPTTQADNDPRLAQRVTYESGYARLHAVADELTRKTGVTIYSGSNSKNWQVRDIPLVVCVKDLPLGKLLSAIAASTHTLISSTTLDSGVKVYRFYRNKRLQDSIDGALKDAQQKQYEQIDWAWDAMLKLAKSPDAQAELAGAVPKAYQMWMAPANLLASLGLDAKDRVLSGEVIHVDFKDPARAPLAEQIRDAHFAFWRSLETAVQPDRKAAWAAFEKPKSEELAASGMSIQLDEGGASGNTDVQISSDVLIGLPNQGGAKMAAAYTFLLRWMSGRLQDVKSLNLPPRPKTDQIADSESDRPTDPRLHLLATDQDWAQALFAAKIKLNAPKDKEYPTFADMINALAEASEINIVSEDFLSHKVRSKDEYGNCFGSETTPSALLRKMNSSWFCNAGDKLVVGWHSSHGLWRKAHADLVPERVMLSLTAKLDTTGVELDDVMPILDLTKEQRSDWVYRSRPTTWLRNLFAHDTPLWQLYASLSPSDRSLARSEEGLPLAKLDTVLACADLKQWSARQRAWIESGSSEAALGKADSQGSMDALLDPDVLRTAVMRLVRAPASWVYGTEITPNGWAWSKQLHYSYVMQIDYDKDGQKGTFKSSDLHTSLPRYSTKRELEPMKKLGSGSSN